MLSILSHCASSPFPQFVAQPAYYFLEKSRGAREENMRSYTRYENWLSFLRFGVSLPTPHSLSSTSHMAAIAYVTQLLQTFLQNAMTSAQVFTNCTPP